MREMIKKKPKKEEKLMELLRKTNPYSMNLPPELVAEIVKNRKARTIQLLE